MKKLLIVGNIALMLAIGFCLFETIFNIFRANWPFAAGYAILTFVSWQAFRWLPMPSTVDNRKRRREILQEINRSETRDREVRKGRAS